MEAVTENAISGLEGADIRLPVGNSPESGPALVRGQIGQVVAGADGGAADPQRPRQRGSAVVRQRPEQRVASQRSWRCRGAVVPVSVAMIRLFEPSMVGPVRPFRSDSVLKPTVLRAMIELCRVAALVVYSPAAWA